MLSETAGHLNQCRAHYLNEVHLLAERVTGSSFQKLFECRQALAETAHEVQCHEDVRGLRLFASNCAKLRRAISWQVEWLGKPAPVYSNLLVLDLHHLHVVEVSQFGLLLLTLANQQFNLLCEVVLQVN